jgi:Raf kinase inhibitor-like YbhB/YbcL family protein
MTLTAPWTPGAEIPLKYTQAGDEVSPAHSWDNVPEAVASFVLLVHDVSAPAGQGADDLLHWMMWNIPGDSRGLPEGVAHGPQREDGARQLSVSGPYYRGPGAPATGPAHVYVFELYALDETINIPAIPAQGVSVAQARTAVMEAMVGHIRGKAVTAGTFKRK